MNIKVNQDYQTAGSRKQKSENNHSKSLKNSFKFSAKQSAYKDTSKDMQNATNCKKMQKTIDEVKSPPPLKRQNTQDSAEGGNLSKKRFQSPESANQKGCLEKSKKKRLMQSKKLNSDEQSTNVYRYNKYSADQQKDPYRISATNPFNKEKSIQPSRDLSITLMCSLDKKSKLNSQKMTENQKSSKNQSPSVRHLKAQINKKIKSFNSLTKLHGYESQYFAKQVRISNEQQKRLQKIHQIEINSLKSDIFLLRDQIQTRFIKQK